MYQVLARTWRPRSFDELIGQAHVARTLANAIESDRVAHAYIFAGLRGTGKTTVARIMAKCLNCAGGPTGTPCDECDACREIAEGRAMDVMELDAASRTGVNDIRELQEMIAYAPVRDRSKVLIIDEAHMLSKPAFNALLKTLEEPPPNVIFILATTELQKLLPTILSRCQVFEFRRVTVVEMVAHLRRICDSEAIEISDAALDRIARAGEGSVRDSLSVLERVVAFCGTQASDDDVMRVLGAVNGRVLVELVQRLAQRDAAGMLGVLDSLLDEGHDLVHFWSQLIAALRDLLVISALPERVELLARPADEAQALSEAAAGLSREDVTRAFQILADLEPGLRSSSQPRYLFEATLIRLASLGTVRPIEDVLAGLGGIPAGPARPATAAQKKKRDAGPPKAVSPATAAPPAAPTPVTPPVARRGLAGLPDAVKRQRPMLGAILDQAVSIGHENEILRICLPAGRDAWRKQLGQSDSLELLRAEAAALIGVEPTVEVILAATTPDGAVPEVPESIDKPVSARTPVPAADAKPPAAAGPATGPDRKPRRRRVQLRESDSLIERARGESGISELLERFGARIVDARPDVVRGATAEPDAGESSREDAT